jgi:competence CoiA-like predicted nuclease
MSKSHISRLGAINAETGDYVHPKLANKCDKHNCPECKQPLILRQGKILRPHFAHKKSDNPCNMYNHPGVSQIHKDAQYLLKHLLERKFKITMERDCGNECKHKAEEFEIPEISITSQIVIEYPFEHNGMKKIADVAYLDNDELVCIFEIYNTHGTDEEERPEPWFEIRATTLINQVSKLDNMCEIKIRCIRSIVCDNCIEEERLNLEKQKKDEEIRKKNEETRELAYRNYYKLKEEREKYKHVMNENRQQYLSNVIADYKRRIYTEYNFQRKVFDRIYYDKYLIAIEDLYKNGLYDLYEREEQLWEDWNHPGGYTDIGGCEHFVMYRFLKYYKLKSPYFTVRDVENHYLKNNNLEMLTDFKYPGERS